MALTFVRVTAVATALEDICGQINALDALIKQFLTYNTDQGIDWLNGGVYLTEDSAGNISGKTYTKTDVSNAINTLNQMKNLLNNVAVNTQGNYLGNVNKVTKPIA